MPHPPLERRRRAVAWLLSVWLVFSGAAALIYQIVWVRLLGLSIGSTALSVSIVLAVFFSGMGAGGYLTARLIGKFGKTLKLYLMVEGCCALAGLTLLPILLHLDLLVSAFPALGAGIAMKIIVVTCLLLVPTFCIGVSFPLVVAIGVRSSEEIGTKLAHLYAFNTLGALLGAVLGGFCLIPYFGLDGATYAAVLLNLLIVLSGGVAYRLFNTPSDGEPVEEARQPLNGRAVAVLVVTGFSALATEVGWTKYLTVYTGSTVYGFSLILAIFLAGIVLGAWCARHRAVAAVQTQKFLFAGVLLLGISLVGARAGLALFPALFEVINGWDFDVFFLKWIKYAAVFVLLLPATFLFGLLFPVTLKRCCSDADCLYGGAGKVYAWNVLAGIAGSLTAGFWLIPRFGTDALLTAMALLVVLTSLLFVIEFTGRFTRMVWIGAVALVVFSSDYAPHLNYRPMIGIVTHGYGQRTHDSGTEEYRALLEGRGGVISMVSDANDPCVVRLLNNGLVESWIDVCDPNHMLLSESLLGLVPYLLNPTAKRAFVLGYGGGTSVRALMLTEVDHIAVVEIEPAVVDAVRLVNHGRLPTDGDTRVTLAFNDARNSLLTGSEEYDIVVSQPSHPWLSGGANTMSKEFFELVRGTLSQKGVYAQWINLFRMDTATLKSLLRAYTDTFEHSLSFVNASGSDLLLFGSRAPLELDFTKIQEILSRPPVGAVMGRYGIDSPSGLMRYFCLSENELADAAGSAEPATDTNLLTEVLFSRHRQNSEKPDSPEAYLRRHYHCDIAPYLAGDDGRHLGRLYEYFMDNGDRDKARLLKAQNGF